MMNAGYKPNKPFSGSLFPGPNGPFKPEHFFLFDEFLPDDKSSGGGGGSNSGCYIATAGYGDYRAPQLMVLRRFRDEVFAESAVGRAFIKTYYLLSPPVAYRLRNAGFANSVVRGILDTGRKNIPWHS